MLRSVILLLLICGLSLLCSAQSHSTRKPSAPTTSPEQAIKPLEQRWLDAIGKRDQGAVDVLLAADFQAIAIDGRTRTRDQELATVIDTTRPVLSRIFGRLDISSLSATVALTRGLIVVDGENIREAHIAFTHVWVLRGAKWQCVSEQETLGND